MVLIKARVLLILLIVPVLIVQGQKNTPTSYHSPIGIPMQLSANFGEIRPNHFHMGIDLKTNGVEGIPIHSIADGFVSRVKISPYGYGKVIYIDHTDGHTSVYAHCSEILGKLGKLIEEIQRLEQDFEIELFLTEEKIPVKRGEKIAISGNTGNSSGPHLHFEIRETTTQVALNPLCHGIEISDLAKPVINCLKIYGLNKDGYLIPGKSRSLPVNLKGSIYQPNNPDIFLPADFYPKNGWIGFSVQMTDQFTNNGNTCGIYSSSLRFDKQEILKLTFDSISFDYSRYVNGYKDYPEYKLNHIKYSKLFKNDCNPLPIYYAPNNGLLRLIPGKKSTVEIACSDIKNNRAQLAFDLTIENGKPSKEAVLFSDANHFLPDSSYLLSGRKAIFQIQRGTFYEPCLKKYNVEDKVFIGDGNQPLQYPILVKLLLPSAQINPDKCYVSVLTNGNSEHALKSYKEGAWLVAKSPHCGVFDIKVDDEAPQIRPLNFSSQNTLNSKKQLRWEIIENETQLVDYDLYINGKWQLLEYESKGNYLIYRVDPKVKGATEVKVIAIDQCGNKVVWKEILSF